MNFVAPASQWRSVLERNIHLSTNREIRNLVVEMEHDRVVLRGQAPSYHIKLLAQNRIRELLPYYRLENSIDVEFRRLGRPAFAY